MEKYSIYVSAVGIYSYNTKNDEAAALRDDIEKLIFAHEGIIQVHGFYLNTETGHISADIVTDFGVAFTMLDTIKNELKEKYPQYTFDIAMDTDVSD